MKKIIVCLIITVGLFHGDLWAQSSSLTGTWRLVSQTATSADGRTTHLDSAQLIQIKMFTPGHFVVIAQAVIHGMKRFLFCVGGKYTLQGDELTEHNEYGSYGGYEQVISKYSFTIKRDTMFQSGSVVHQNGSKSYFKELYIRSR